MTRGSLWFALAAMVWAASAGQAQEEGRTALLQGVNTIAAPGSPGGLSTLGPDAFPVVAGPSGNGSRCAVVAAARWERGRIVAFGHDGYFDPRNIRRGETERLLQNTVRWLSGNRPPRVGVVQLPPMANWLQRAGFQSSEARPDADLGPYTVLVMTHAAMEGEFRDRLGDWVRRGGGLMAASTGWGWSQITGKPLSEHPGSLLTMHAGIIWNNATLTGRQGTFPATAETPELIHAGRALTRIRQGGLDRQEARQALSSCLLAIGSLPPGAVPFRSRVQEAVSSRPVVPTAAKPVGVADPIAALTLAVTTREAQSAPPEQVRAHPAAADFPGAAPANAPRVTRTASVDRAIPGWTGLGLYAPAGAQVTLTLPFAQLRGNWQVRIGAHSDELWHLASWQRSPEITRTFRISGRETRVASGFGGLLYIVVPENAGTGRIDVTVAGAVEAPIFRLGQTSLAEWRELRRRPAPWAELEGTRMVFTVPSDAIRNLERPDTLMTLWDQLVVSQEALVASPRRVRLERIVADRQISAGYMHAGYPIMTPVDESMHHALNEAKMRAEGTWGHLHELGHNLQEPEWTFDGTGEVTNNVLVLYAFEKVLKLPFDSGHPGIKDRAARAQTVKKYIEGGSNFETWKKEPFLALTMYIEVIDRFGFGPLEKVFAGYRALRQEHRPKTDDERRDQWLINLSRATGSNLAPFFRRWGVPVSEAARMEVRNLPAWGGP